MAAWAICGPCGGKATEWVDLMNGTFKCPGCGVVRAWVTNAEASRPYPWRPDDRFLTGLDDTDDEIAAMRREADLGRHDFEEPFAA